MDDNPQIDIARLDVSSVSPAVVYLAHEDCAINGDVLTVAAGRVARIFTGTAPGFISDNLTPEEIADNLATIYDDKNYIVPASSVEQYNLQPS